MLGPCGKISGKPVIWGPDRRLVSGYDRACSEGLPSYDEGDVLHGAWHDEPAPVPLRMAHDGLFLHYPE